MGLSILCNLKLQKNWGDINCLENTWVKFLLKLFILILICFFPEWSHFEYSWGSFIKTKMSLGIRWFEWVFKTIISFAFQLLLSHIPPNSWHLYNNTLFIIYLLLWIKECKWWFQDVYRGTFVIKGYLQEYVGGPFYDI